MTMTRGRGSSAVRRPSLIRDYLRGEVAFPLDEPGDALARTLDGDYISRMHQRVKLRIREIDPGYQSPHSPFPKARKEIPNLAERHRRSVREFLKRFRRMRKPIRKASVAVRKNRPKMAGPRMK